MTLRLRRIACELTFTFIASALIQLYYCDGQVVLKACAIGLTINTLLALWENFIMAELACDGLFVAYWECNECSSGYFECNASAELESCSLASVSQILKFWAMLTPAIVLAVALEVFLLGVPLPL